MHVALSVKQVAAGDVYKILLDTWLCNGESAKLVLVTPFKR